VGQLGTAASHQHPTGGGGRLTEPASEAELLELPREFAGLPYETRRDAQRWAEVAIPYGPLLAVGLAVAEQVVVQATAHHIAMTDDGYAEFRRPSSPENTGKWAGTPWGDAVAAALQTHLARASGRGRHYPMAV
jgi:hypothetical protein